MRCFRTPNPLRRAACEPLSGFEQFGSGPVGTSCGQDCCVLGCREPDFHGDGSALAVGESGSSGAGHEPSIAGYGKFGNVLDTATSEGHNKDMNTAAKLTATKTNIGTCNWAGHRFVGEVAFTYPTRCPSCESHTNIDAYGRPYKVYALVTWKTLKARVSNHPCDEACTSAKRDTCSCKCGGENHGRDLIGVAL